MAISREEWASMVMGHEEVSQKLHKILDEFADVPGANLADAGESLVEKHRAVLKAWVDLVRKMDRFQRSLEGEARVCGGECGGTEMCADGCGMPMWASLGIRASQVLKKNDE